MLYVALVFFSLLLSSLIAIQLYGFWKIRAFQRALMIKISSLDHSIAAGIGHLDHSIAAGIGHIEDTVRLLSDLKLQEVCRRCGIGLLGQICY